MQQQRQQQLAAFFAGLPVEVARFSAACCARGRRAAGLPPLTMLGPAWTRLYTITPMPGAHLKICWSSPPPHFPFSPPFPTISPHPPVLCIPPATFLVDAVGCALFLPLYMSRWCSHYEYDAPSSPPMCVSGGCWNPFARSYATPGAKVAVATVDTALSLSWRV